MNISQYIIESSRTCPNIKSENLTSEFLDQLHMAIGASTETNELLDAYKKSFAYGKPLDVINIKEEIFDTLWYLANLCRMLGIDFEDGMQNNIDKLQARYPEKFDSYKAINRNLEREREILEELQYPKK